jgi:hypothetical protein
LKAMHSDLTVEEARAILERSGACPTVDADDDSVFDIIQASPAEGHLIEPFAAFDDGDVVVAWRWPGREGPPVIALARSDGAHEVIASSPLVFLQFLGARWTPAWSFATDLDADAAASVDALRSVVGPPPFAPDSDAHRDALGHPLPELGDALVPYHPVEIALDPSNPLTPMWREMRSGNVSSALEHVRALKDRVDLSSHQRASLADWCGSVGAHELAVELSRTAGDSWRAIRHRYAFDPSGAIAEAMESVLAELRSPPPDGLADLRGVRDAFEERHRPWLTVRAEQRRPRERLDALYRALDQWLGFPRTQAHLRLQAAAVAIDLRGWDEAERLLETIDLAEVDAQLRSLREAVAAGRSQPPPEGLDGLRARLRSAKEEERELLEAELGLRLCLEAAWTEAYRHVEQAMMALPSRYPHMALLVEILETLDSEGALDSEILERVRKALAAMP